MTSSSTKGDGQDRALPPAEDRAVVNGAASVSALRASVPSACRNCAGEEWVCENHPDRPWDGMSNREDACGCGAGAPCPVCSGLHFSTMMERAVSAIEALPESYSGWNPHDEQHDEGVESGKRQAIEAIRGYAAQAMSAREGQDPQGLGVKPASAVPKGCAHD
jgi:hypothetical protein